MPNDILIMLKRTLFSNLCCGGILTLLIFIIFRQYGYIFAVGLAVGELNLFINAVITNLLILKMNGRYASIYIISFIARVSLIAIIGFIFFTYNTYSAAAYLLGYSSHFIGILIYSHGISSNEKGSD